MIPLPHGIPFPPQAGPLQQGWSDGQKKLAALSSDSRLTTAEKSNHQIFLDEPGIVVDAIARVYAAATRHRVD